MTRMLTFSKAMRYLRKPPQRNFETEMRQYLSLYRELRYIFLHYFSGVNKYFLGLDRSGFLRHLDPERYIHYILGSYELPKERVYKIISKTVADYLTDLHRIGFKDSRGMGSFELLLSSFPDVASVLKSYVESLEIDREKFIAHHASVMNEIQNRYMKIFGDYVCSQIRKGQCKNVVIFIDSCNYYVQPMPEFVENLEDCMSISFRNGYKEAGRRRLALSDEMVCSTQGLTVISEVIQKWLKYNNVRVIIAYRADAAYHMDMTRIVGLDNLEHIENKKLYLIASHYPDSPALVMNARFYLEHAHNPAHSEKTALKTFSDIMSLYPPFFPLGSAGDRETAQLTHDQKTAKYHADIEEYRSQGRKTDHFILYPTMSDITTLPKRSQSLMKLKIG